MATRNARTAGEFSPDFAVPCTAGYEYITPEAARDMLEIGGADRRNRRLSAPSVIRMEGILRRQEWMYDSTDAIGFAEDGSLVNGQHRLQAIANSGAEGFWCLVARGVRPEVIKVIDQQSGRTLAQALEIDGRWAEPSPVASMITHLYAIKGRWHASVPAAYRMTVPQGLELLLEHKDIVGSLPVGKRMQKTLNALPTAIWATAHYVFSAADEDAAGRFYAALETGDAEPDSPVILLRERFQAEPEKYMRGKKILERSSAEFLLFSAWNITQADREMTAKERQQIRSGFPVAASLPHVANVEWLEA